VATPISTNSDGKVVKTKSGDVYAGNGDTVYKKDSNGNWSQNSGNGWQSTTTPQSASAKASVFQRVRQPAGADPAAVQFFPAAAVRQCDNGQCLLCVQFLEPAAKGPGVSISGPLLGQPAKPERSVLATLWREQPFLWIKFLQRTFFGWSLGRWQKVIHFQLGMINRTQYKSNKLY
jgi:hypothetical protein